jgi:DNA (cytosine-5)-methyltransferase 1
VRGLLNHNNGETFKTIERVIRKIGYSFDYKIIRASDFGLPQHRPRLHMIGFKEYLYQNIKFDTPSSTRHHFGSIYEKYGKQFINLNIQLRFL